MTAREAPGSPKPATYQDEPVAGAGGGKGPDSSAPGLYNTGDGPAAGGKPMGGNEKKPTVPGGQSGRNTRGKFPNELPSGEQNSGG